MTETQQVGKRTVTHVALDEKDTLAAGRNGLGQVDRNGGLALVRDGGRHGNGLDRRIDTRKANVCQQRLSCVAKGEGIAGFLFTGHELLTALHNGETTDNGHTEQLDGIVNGADAGIEHVE